MNRFCSGYEVRCRWFSLRGQGFGAYLPTMFRGLYVFLLIGLLAGLGVRASGAHFDSCPPTAHQDGCCEDEKEMKVAQEHGPECPPFHHDHHDHDHHHGPCCHAPTWFPSQVTAPVIFHPGFLQNGNRIGNESPPDGPVLSLDKPPLI